ncbi:hypothetical protein GWK48_07400 [Metallosphaera tengchongensis]|uniref:DUF2269 family protein n=1 Tax=Metallosphaera tengchongensis TaxID=1532350 RepID=A0A6N0NWG9_9CREN|nr:hypothetical protein [Metallosphaera tengchongensis]QKR00223.1 hypothetical protein GWK48_07400 [Metallosphaera tengchongensis]
MAYETKFISPYSFITLLVPIFALVIVLTLRNLVWLNYIHVLTGGTWTGVDLFMGLVMSRVLRSLDPKSRAEIIKRLVPMMLFFMPSLAAVATTAGFFLASWLGIFSFKNILILLSGVIVLILIIQGFGVIVPNEVRIVLELRKEEPDLNKVVKLGMRNIYVSGSQVVFQIVIIFIMANLVL